jgi:hypothetical protein
MKISQQDVLQFKHRHTDENGIIADIIRQRLYAHFEELILDVGAGVGDITTGALPDKRVVQIDVLDYGPRALPEKHRRLVKDFFDYEPGEGVGTLLLAHVLQFIDQDGPRLNGKVQELSPKKVVTVTNVNDEFMGELLDWVGLNFGHANPEVEVPGFPAGYRPVEEVGFAGQVSCEDYRSLGRQVAYLMDCEPTPAEAGALEEFLCAGLASPRFTINQRVRVYDRT